jgi:hypothetical protein
MTGTSSDNRIILSFWAMALELSSHDRIKKRTDEKGILIITLMIITWAYFLFELLRNKKGTHLGAFLLFGYWC